MATNFCLHLMTVELIENKGLNICVLLVWGLFTTEHIDYGIRKKTSFGLHKLKYLEMTPLSPYQTYPKYRDSRNIYESLYERYFWAYEDIEMNIHQNRLIHSHL